MTASPFVRIEAAARRAAAEALPKGGLPAAARAAIAVAEKAMAQASALPDTARALARIGCGPCCDACCHQVVGVTLAELALAAQAASALPDEARARLTGRLAEVKRRAEGIALAEWWKQKIPCPLLDGGLCTIHGDRPLPCRAFASADAGACKASLAGEAVRIPLFATQHAIYGHAQAGLAQALAAAGMKQGPIALALAL